MEGEKKSEICQFYKMGKCRFGTECFNLHQGPQTITEKKKCVVAKNQKNEDSAECKKQPMKTAADVIKRIEWDELMPRESFVIGYLDRFEGLVEDNFTKFSNWGNLVDAEYEALAIPQHRIEYFKYRGTKVWDKKSKLDLVFGSSGDNGGKTIEEIMNEVDDRYV